MNLRSALVLVALFVPAAVHAQAGTTKEEKDEEKIERTGARNGAVKIKLTEKERPKMDATQPPVPVPKQPPSPQPYRPEVDYHGPIPYLDDDGRIRNLHDHRYMSKEEALKAPWYADKNKGWDGVSKQPFDVVERSTKRVLSPELVVKPSKAKYDEVTKANGGKRPRVEDSIVERPKPVPARPRPPQKREFDKAFRDGKWVDASTLSPEERKKHDDSFDTSKRLGKIAKVDPKVEIAQIGATGKLGFDWDGVGMKNGEITLTPENRYVEAKLKVAQLEGTAAGRVGVGPDGVEATVNLEGKAVLIGLAVESGKAQAGDKNLGASIYARGEAAVLAEAKAQGKAKVGLDGVELVADVGAFAGAKAKIEVPATVNIGGTETRVTAAGEVSYGIGADGKAYMKIDWKTLSFKGGAKGHVALGVGAGADLNVEFSAAELVKQLPSPAEIKAGYDQAVTTIEKSVVAAEIRVAHYAVDAAQRIEASKRIAVQTGVKQIVGTIEAVREVKPVEVVTNPTRTAVKVALPAVVDGVNGARKVQRQFIESEINKDAYNLRKAIQATPVVPRPVGRLLDSIFGANVPAGPRGWDGGRYNVTTFGAGEALAQGNSAEADRAAGAGMERL